MRRRDDSFLLQRDLLARGWTKPSIAKFLGEPDKIRRRLDSGEYHLFSCERVLRAESLKPFQAERDKVLAGREARRVAALKRETTNEYLAEVSNSLFDDQHHWSDHPAVGLYRVELKAAQEREALRIYGVLPSLFAINREAKRYRDAARKHWGDGSKALAGECAERKKSLYALKSQVVGWLVVEGKLKHVGWHSFVGNIAEVLEGEGFRFHRPAAKASGPVIPLKEIESKPKERAEVPVDIAEKALRGFLQGRAWLRVYEWPERQRNSHEFDDEQYFHNTYSGEA